ncbi:hypothetical protein [Methylorubrum aminovorans]|uniref:hypothetical protein n=1 Tax=Methylorubrum aminovorans TaxID=269069 RepID=UPI003C2D11CB
MLDQASQSHQRGRGTSDFGGEHLIGARLGVNGARSRVRCDAGEEAGDLLSDPGKVGSAVHWRALQCSGHCSASSRMIAAVSGETRHRISMCRVWIFSRGSVSVPGAETHCLWGRRALCTDMQV